jgi:integrase
MQVTPTTRSEKTQRIYDNRVETTMRRYQRETHGHTWADNPMAFAEWMTQQKSRWKKSTWRMTRLAVQEYLQKSGAPVEAIQHFSVGDNPSSKAVGQFDATRVKGLPDEDLEKLVRLLTDPQTQATHKLRGGTYDAMLAAFLQANVLIGLRPSEWDTAQWSSLDGSQVLRVENRKTTNGRSNGAIRLLAVHPDSVQTVQEAILERDRLYSLGIGWTEIQKGMSSRLQEIRHLVTRKTYTLYSTRHRFVSGAKQSGYNKRDIADMLGHSSEETAGLHYGRKNAKTAGGRSDTPTEKLADEGAESPIIGVTMGIGVSAPESVANPMPEETRRRSETESGTPASP